MGLKKFRGANDIVAEDKPSPEDKTTDNSLKSKEPYIDHFNYASEDILIPRLALKET